MNENIAKTRLGNYVREQREKRKLTQEKLGELTELSTVTISAIERGVKAPSFESLCALIKVLNLDARRIFPYDPGNLGDHEDAYRCFCEMGKGMRSDQLNSLMSFVNRMQR